MAGMFASLVREVNWLAGFLFLGADSFGLPIDKFHNKKIVIVHLKKLLCFQYLLYSSPHYSESHGLEIRSILLYIIKICFLHYSKLFTI